MVNNNITAPITAPVTEAIPDSVTPDIIGLPIPTLRLPLKTSLVGINSDVGPTFSRSTTAKVVDFEGIVNTAKIDEARFTGVRRVENLCSNSETYATETINVFSGVDYIFSMEGTGSVTFSGAATGTLNGISGQRVQVTKTTSSTSLTIAVSGSVLKAQLELVIGSQTEASEYISVGILSTPYHGATVDGVKYFKSDRDENLINESTLIGYRCDKESTNLALYSEDFSNIIWADNAGGVTLNTNDSISPDGTKTADKITQIDQLADGKRQSIILPISTTFNVSVFFKNINSNRSKILINDQDNLVVLAELNFNWTLDVPSTFSSFGASNIKYKELYNGWYRISFTFTTSETGVNYPIIIYPETSVIATNSVYVWGVQLEQSAFSTSYIKTDGTTVTRTSDELCYDNTNNIVLPNFFSMVLSTIPAADGEDYETGAVRLFGTEDSRGSSNEVSVTQGAAYGFTPSTGGGVFTILDTDLDADTENKYGFQLYQNGSNSVAKIFLNGVLKHQETNVQTLDHSNTNVCFGFYDTDYYTGNIKDIQIFSKELTDRQFIELTK